MQIFVINLDRTPARWHRMETLLKGLPVRRITAVDGRTIDGPEVNDLKRLPNYQALSRYNRACILSHRAAWREFLASGEAFGCVLEDDVFLGLEFSRFISDTGWIPSGSDLVKLETTGQEVLLSRKTIRCFSRRAAVLSSVHLGSAAYIVSRRGAQVLLETTALPDRAIDRIMFDDAGFRKNHVVFQLVPALCIQASHRANGMIFPEMESTIQPKVQPPIVKRVKKTPINKIKRELVRPFHQLLRVAKSINPFNSDRLKGLSRGPVPFA